MLEFIDRWDRFARRLDAALPEEDGEAGLDLSDYADDFVGFAGLLEIDTKDAERVPLVLNPIQERFDADRSGRDIVLKPRQVGLTTEELARDLWFFLTRPGSRVVVVCQSMQRHEARDGISRALRLMIDALRRRGARIELRTESLARWELKYGSTLAIEEAGASEKSASKKGRSGTINRLHITELAFFEHAGATLNAILECVPAPRTGSEIVLESTANGAAGVFFEMYTAARAGSSSYRAHFFSWLEQAEYSEAVPAGELLAPETDRERALATRLGATPEQIRWYRGKVRDKGQDLTDQEYPLDEETCWLAAGRLFFDKEISRRLIDHQARRPLRVERRGDGELRIWAEPEKGHAYVIVADPSEGTGGDPGAACVYERATGEHVATLHGQFPPWAFGAELATLGRTYESALVVVERNNHGHAVLASLLQGDSKTEPPRAPYARVFYAEDEKPGWYSTEIRRSAALDALEGAHRAGTWSSPDRAVLGELLTFVVNKNGKAEAAKGAHDDLVMTAAIAHDVLRRPRTAFTAVLVSGRE